MAIRSICHPFLVRPSAQGFYSSPGCCRILPQAEHQSAQQYSSNRTEVSNVAHYIYARFLIYMINRAVNRICAHIKIRTFSKSNEQLWLDEWENPLRRDIPVDDPAEFIRRHGQPGYPSGQAGYVSNRSIEILPLRTFHTETFASTKSRRVSYYGPRR